MSAQHLRVTTPQGDAGELSHEQNQYLFGYQTANAAAAVSLSMPVRKAQYAHAALHPIFQMNLPEGFLLEELQNRLAKIVNLEPMMLLALSGGQSPIGRVTVQSNYGNPLARQQGHGERLSEILDWDGTENLFTELVDKYIYRTGISGVQPKVLVPQVMAPTPSKARPDRQKWPSGIPRPGGQRVSLHEYCQGIGLGGTRVLFVKKQRAVRHAAIRQNA